MIQDRMFNAERFDVIIDFAGLAGKFFLLANDAHAPLIAYAYERHVILRADNGVNLNHVRENVLEGLVKYQFRSMTCSVDGASDATYSIYRVRGDFDTVIENIRRINRFKEQSHGELRAWRVAAFGPSVALAFDKSRRFGAAKIKLAGFAKRTDTNVYREVAVRGKTLSKEEFAKRHLQTSHLSTGCLHLPCE